MNTKIASFFGFLSLLALAACGQSPTDAATPTLDFGFDDARAACQASSDCILMKLGGCDVVDAIQVSQVEMAREYSEQSKKQFQNVQCAPSLPIEAFEPLCLNQKCRAVPGNYHLLLEAPDQPIAGQPFWIGLRFRFNRAAGQVEARILLPPGVEVVAGQAEWSGAIEAGQELVFWVQVQANRAGRMNFMGWAKLQDDPAMPPLNETLSLDVVSPGALTPWPERERILATPTRAFTPTATLTRQPTATASIIPTPTPHPALVFAEPLLASIAGQKPDYHDEFSNLKSGWESNIFRDPCCSGFTYYQDGVYVVVASPPQPGQPDGWNWAWGNNQTIIPGISNYVFEIEQRWVSGSGLAGISLGRDVDNFSVRLSSPDACFDFRRESIYPERKREYFNGLTIPQVQSLYEPVTLTIVKKGREISLFVNRQPLYYLLLTEKDQPKFNFIELRVGNTSAQTQAEVHWDNLKVWVLQP
jgi:hypothetical protein